MSGDNGKGVELGQRMLGVEDRLPDMSGRHTDEVLDRLADQLGDRVVDKFRGVVQEEVRHAVNPRLDEIESKMEETNHRLVEVETRPAPRPDDVPSSQQELQHQARNRVD